MPISLSGRHPLVIGIGSSTFMGGNMDFASLMSLLFLSRVSLGLLVHSLFCKYLLFKLLCYLFLFYFILFLPYLDFFLNFSFLFLFSIFLFLHLLFIIMLIHFIDLDLRRGQDLGDLKTRHYTGRGKQQHNIQIFMLNT